ncbi:hypothetical protein D3C80_2148410 [compost metagenome]
MITPTIYIQCMPIKFYLAVRASGKIFSVVVGAVARELEIFDKMLFAVFPAF